MPVIIKVDKLEPGMVLSRQLSNNYNVLFPSGKEMTAGDITALKRRYPDLEVSVTYNVLDKRVDFQDDSKDRETSRVARGIVTNLTQKIVSKIKPGASISPDDLAAVQGELEPVLNSIREKLAKVAVIGEATASEDYFKAHASNVLYLSLVVGYTLRSFVKTERERLSIVKSLSMDLSPLAIAAFFIDVGMIPFEQMIDKNDQITLEEAQQIKNHPVEGAKMLPEATSKVALQAIRQHHENHDGTGYPNRVPGDKISIFGRILRVVDSYCAATADKLHRKGKHPVAVLYEMLYGKSTKKYDPIVLKVFARVVHPLPIGAKLLLNTGEYGVVIKVNPFNPFNPQLVIVFDTNDNELEVPSEPFLLSDRSEIEVIAFGEHDIRFVNKVSGLDYDDDEVNQYFYKNETVTSP